MLLTECGVAEAFSPGDAAKPWHTFQGLWDTGATGSVITQNVVDKLGLKPTGMTMVSHADGESMMETFLVNIGLLNGVFFPGLRVTKGNLKGFDILIGMDIITHGDFVLTNKNGKTVFTFRTPSLAEIDFVQGSNNGRPGRNDPCACNSGKKFKNCCGGLRH